LVWREGLRLYRDLPWRRTREPYPILLSEVMLQQTQVGRVERYWQRWLERFPSLDALAAASLGDALKAWQGLGYNRRAKALYELAKVCARDYVGALPVEYDQLLALPGVGPATAAGVCVFAYDKPCIYLETNVRAVFLHHFFPEVARVSDRELIPLVAQSCDQDDPRGWYYALLDYGAWLKKALPNPSRRSRNHRRQSPFVGSLRQKRAELLRLVLAEPGQGGDELVESLTAIEVAAGRPVPDPQLCLDLLNELDKEGFLRKSESQRWFIA
jgi:A/G-specific adenine glycosylase